MNKNRILQDYFEWMYDLVCKNKGSDKISYEELLLHLYNTPFTAVMDRDLNRADDGVCLRTRYIKVRHLSESYAYDVFKDKECSVLEMMIALAVRCEETIMDNPSLGDRTSQWFWGMIVSLGLGGMYNEHYNEEQVTDIVTKFLNRNYSPNGKGGLFTIKNCDKDLRDVEIWVQLCWYLNTIS